MFNHSLFSNWVPTNTTIRPPPCVWRKDLWIRRSIESKIFNLLTPAVPHRITDDWHYIKKISLCSFKDVSKQIWLNIYFFKISDRSISFWSIKMCCGQNTINILKRSTSQMCGKCFQINKICAYNINSELLNVFLHTYTHIHIQIKMLSAIKAIVVLP